MLTVVIWKIKALCFWGGLGISAAAAGDWRVFSETVGRERFLKVGDGELLVVFRESPAWTVSEAHWRGRRIGNPSGGTGTVVQWRRDDPYLCASDIPDWPRMRRLLLTASEEPFSLMSKLKKLIPADGSERKTIPDSALKALNTAMDSPDFFDKRFLDAPPFDGENSRRVYALRELEALKTAGGASSPQAVAARNRMLLDLSFPDIVRPVVQAVGTVHGGETVSLLTVSAGGRDTAVVTDGKITDSALNLSGPVVRVRKLSVIGPFNHEAVFEFNSGVSLLITHRFTANDEIKRGRFDGYRYVFMFMMPEIFDHWFPLMDNGAGDVLLLDSNVKAGAYLNSPVRGVIAYAPKWRTGVAYVYPETYPGVNHIDARTGKDRKFRAALFAESYAPGQFSEFRVTVTPFEADPEQWIRAGLSAAALRK